PAAIEGGFDSANPAARMYAIEQAGKSGDRTAIPRLVEQLDSDDCAVRLLAITSLERLTGETYGYRHYDPPEEREAAVERWTCAVRSGQLPTSRSAERGFGATPPAPPEGGRGG